MTALAITGARGLLGSHLRIHAQALEIADIRSVDRSAFANPAQMDSALAGADAVVHCAAKIRGTEDEVLGENRAITRALLDALERTGGRPHILFASSINAHRTDPHGQSKREADATLRDWCTANGARYTELVLPHIFGEGGRPRHNSVISTFCAQIAAGETPTVTADGEIEPLHAQRAAEHILTLIDDSDERIRSARFSGTPIRVGILLQKLRAMAASYAGHVIPDLRDPFDLDLFNTYRSYLFPRHYPVAMERRVDARGWLVELVRELNGGQTFYSVTRPGVTRGNHFHRRKVERFVVLSGQAEIALRRIGDETPVRFNVSGDEPVYVDIPTLHAHNITNTGSCDLVTLFWVHELFDPERPDTYAETV